MKAKIFILSMIIIGLLFSGCAPSESAIQTAIVQTQQKNPTATVVPTSTPVPTSTFTVTPSFTPSPTSTVTPTFTQTPDIRIVDTDPQKMLCTDKELPEEGKYYIPGPDWMSVNTNEEVISIRGVEAGRNYVIKTGRVTGWWVDMKRGTRAASLPEELGCGVYMFKTSEGAKIALTKFNSVETDTKKLGWRYLNQDIELGDANNVIALYRTDSGGNRNTNIQIEIVYKNLLITVDGYAYREEDVPLNVLISTMTKIFERIKQEPVVLPSEAVIAK